MYNLYPAEAFEEGLLNDLYILVGHPSETTMLVHAGTGREMQAVVCHHARDEQALAHTIKCEVPRCFKRPVEIR